MVFAGKRKIGSIVHDILLHIEARYNELHLWYILVFGLNSKYENKIFFMARF